MTAVERQPSEMEISAVITAFGQLSQYINLKDGSINAWNWQDVYYTLANLSDYELWLGVCSLEQSIFNATEHISPVRATMYELFRIAYEQGLEAL